MMKFRINEAKGMFFDRDAVLDAIDAASKRVLPKAGAYVQTDAKRSMRPAKQKPVAALTEAERQSFKRRQDLYKSGKSKVKPKRPLVASNPGEPPRTRTGLVRKFLFFAFDPQTKSVVVGPALLNKSTMAQSTLETGGMTMGIVSREITLDDGTVLTTRKEAMVKIAPRPFMQPALQRNQAKVAELFRNSIKK